MAFKKKFNRILNAVMSFSDMLVDNHVFAYSAQASFFVVISAVPFLMLVINVLQAVLPISRENFAGFIAILPIQIQSLASEFVNDFFEDSSISLVSITSIFLIFMASRGVRSLSKGLKVVFNTYEEHNNYIKETAWSLLYTLIFMVSIIVCVASLLFGKYLAGVIEKNIPVFRHVVELILDLRYLILFIFLTLVFMTAYKFLGRSKIKFFGHFVGASLASGFWLGFSGAYSLYVRNLANFSYVYGSLTAVIFLMLWLWFCMTALLFGAEVNRLLYEKDINILKIFKKKS